MDFEQIKILASKYLAGTATADEARQLHEWFNLVNADDTELVLSETITMPLQLQSEMLAEIMEAIGGSEKASMAPLAKNTGWWRFAAAAVLLFVLSGVYLLLVNKPKQQAAANNSPIKQDVAPGGNKAILTLANGTTVVLDSAANGKIASEGNVTVQKQANGQLAYTLNGHTAEVLYNTMSTPKGGQYRLTLQDGTAVWLNAASSIRFPTFFSGKERVVEITGEAYFEVAHNAAMPFHVKVNGVDVEDVGTHFNINAYTDESSIKTTLLQGKVKVKGVLLAPGQQAQVTNGAVNVVQNADVEEAVAWKNGYFQFNHAGLAAVMRQIARWYDVEVSYEGNIPKQEFGGAMERGLNLSQVLKLLEKSQVHFKIDGKKIIVSP